MNSRQRSHSRSDRAKLRFRFWNNTLVIDLPHAFNYELLALRVLWSVRMVSNVFKIADSPLYFFITALSFKSLHETFDVHRNLFSFRHSILMLIKIKLNAYFLHLLLSEPLSSSIFSSECLWWWDLWFDIGFLEF